MLRMTADDNPRVLTFRLEGRLEGPWVDELERCWQTLVEQGCEPTVRVDLTGVTFVDAAGKARLADMHEQGARFITGDCLTKAIVAEIVGDDQRSTQSREETSDDTTTWQSSPTERRGASGA